MLVII